VTCPEKTSGRRVPWVVGVTGASGTAYAAAVLRGLLDAGEAVDLVISQAARLTMVDELGFAVRDRSWGEDLARWIGREIGDTVYWSSSDWAAGPSSGSYRTKGMVVVPATTAVVSGIALALSKDLIQRVGDVTLKERRPLILVVREMPLRAVVLEHMASLAREGAVVMPAAPAFYAGIADVQSMVDFVAGRALDACGVDHDLYTRWTGELGAASASRAPNAEPVGT
jgi:4-hydroxy-3-polyprenylbenzoate decarboxylase